jgi:hypothetical protein
MAGEQRTTNVSMVYQRAAGTMVIANGPTNPTETEWATYIASIKDLGSQVQRVLVFTAGGTLNAKQRADIERLLGKVRISILTNSIVARGTVTALSWFGISVAAFAHDQVTRAMDYIGVPPGERELVRETLERAKIRVI